MSTNWTDPTGEDYRRSTGEPDPRQPEDAPPASVPPGYAQAPASPDQVGQPYPTYGQPTYGQPAYGQQPRYGYPNPGSPYAPGPPAAKGSIIILLVLSIPLLFAGCIVLGLPSLVLSIVALNRASSDGPSAKRLSLIGWIVFGVCAALVIAFWTLLVVLAPSSVSSAVSGSVV